MAAGLTCSNSPSSAAVSPPESVVISAANTRADIRCIPALVMISASFSMKRLVASASRPVIVMATSSLTVPRATRTFASFTNFTTL